VGFISALSPKSFVEERLDVQPNMKWQSEDSWLKVGRGAENVLQYDT
jgi:hypothetical protein